MEGLLSTGPTPSSLLSALTKAVTLLGHRDQGGVGTWGWEKYRYTLSTTIIPKPLKRLHKTCLVTIVLQVHNIFPILHLVRTSWMMKVYNDNV